MDNQFNLNRFGMLLKKHTTENYKSYLMALAVLIGMLIIVFGLVSHSAGRLPVDVQRGVFIGFLLFGGTIFTSTIFADLSDKKRTIASLTLPASNFEKFMVGWLFSYVIFQVLFIAAFYAVVTVLLSTHAGHGPDFEPVNILDGNTFLTVFLSSYAMLHAVALWGALFFEKLHFIKTAFSLFILMALLAMANKPVMATALHKDLDGAVIWSPVGFVENSRYINITIPEHHNYNLIYFGIVLTLVLWTTAYYKLKEKEV